MSKNTLSSKFNSIEGELNLRLFERQEVVHGLTLAILSDTNMLLLGSPGTGKSLLVSLWSNHINEARYFDWMLTKFSTPEEIFGPFSLSALEKDKYVRNIEGKLPTAHFAFIDEIFKAGSAILNSMLTLLNERIFYNDGKAIKTPLLTLIGASNEIPEAEDGLDALYDRFQLKYQVLPLHDSSNFKKMMKSSFGEPNTVISLDDINTAKSQIAEISFTDAAVDMLLKIRMAIMSNRKKNAQLTVTDRTYKTCEKLLKTEAWLQNREYVEDEDFMILQHVLWSDPAQRRAAASVVLDAVNPEQNKVTRIFEMAEELAHKVLNADRKGGKKNIESGLEAANKLKDAKQKMSNYIEDMRQKKKDVKQASKQLKQIDEMLQRIFSELCGIDKDFL